LEQEVTHTRNPADNSRQKDRLAYYIWLAKLAEKGKISAIFFADIYGGSEVYGGSEDAFFKSGTVCAMLDPITMISAMAAVTTSVGFAVTGSTSYIREFIRYL
jgi:alkanesulfonate monooxygenase SsuD/methylene tetrahydromethanopterin reductase-like flavin-dependent oxidoreductase (luciferase family)